MTRLNVTTVTSARTPGMMQLGTTAGAGAPGQQRLATIRVDMKLRRGAERPAFAEIWVRESGRFRPVGRRNFATGESFIDVSTDLSKDPSISVISSMLTEGTNQLEFGPLPPDIQLQKTTIRTIAQTGGVLSGFRFRQPDTRRPATAAKKALPAFGEAPPPDDPPPITSGTATRAAAAGTGLLSNLMTRKSDR